jgi:putative ABC transport system permease protein
MCCVNIANLLLARGAVRQREFAIRSSLGGGRTRLTRQVFTENFLLALVGGLAGWFLAVVLVRMLPNLQGFYLPRLDEVQPGGRMLLITAGVTIASGLVFGAVPAWRASRRNIRELLGNAPGTQAATPAGMGLRRMLVTVQIGLSVMLLCGAGLLLNSFIRLATVDVGFHMGNVVAVRVNLPQKHYVPARALWFYRQLMEEIRRLPGVEEVSAADYLPLQAVHFPYQLSVEGTRTTTKEVLARHVEPRYFKALGVPVVAGREFEPADETRFPIPVVLNVEAARRLFETERDALGKTIRTSYRRTSRLEVIGVASNVRQLGLRQSPGPQMYLPIQFGSPGYAIARVAANAGDLAAAMRSAVYRLDPAVPVPDVSSLDTWFEREVAKPRLYLLLFGVFALAGLLIAAAGIYSLIAFNVSRRTNEFGVRLALGAGRKDLLRSVVSREAIPIAAGVLIGVVGALATTRLIASLLYGVRPNDGATFLAACLLLSTIALLACYLAARRATLLEPSVALRHE